MPHRRPLTLSLAAAALALACSACKTGSSNPEDSTFELVPTAQAATKRKAGSGVLLKSKRHDGPVPNPGVELVAGKTALVVTDPQNDFLSPEGVTWGVVGKSVEANHTVDHLDQLMSAAAEAGVPLFVSPHYYYPHDHSWEFGGGVEKMMHAIKMFDRSGALSLANFEGSGADWLKRLAPHIDGKAIVANPHKVYGPETNDLVLQLRKRGIDKVVLAGMSANLCVEAHMRALVEAGFEVAVVEDATAAAQTPAGDGYAAALTNFRYIAGALVNTEEAVGAMAKL